MPWRLETTSKANSHPKKCTSQKEGGCNLRATYWCVHGRATPALREQNKGEELSWFSQAWRTMVSLTAMLFMCIYLPSITYFFISLFLYCRFISDHRTLGTRVHNVVGRVWTFPFGSLCYLWDCFRVVLKEEETSLGSCHSIPCAARYFFWDSHSTSRVSASKTIVLHSCVEFGQFTTTTRIFTMRDCW